MTSKVKVDNTTSTSLLGDLLIAKGVAFYNLVYHPSDSDDAHMGTASFVGVMYFSGEIKGKGKGDILFLGTGSYDGKRGPICEWESDPKTGTGDLVGLEATGGYKGTKGKDVTLEIKA